MESLEGALRDILIRFLPECPDCFCNDIEYTDSILSAREDHLIHMYGDGVRLFFVYGYLSVFTTQREVDQQRQ